jgi:hypothetical protein
MKRALPGNDGGGSQQEAAQQAFYLNAFGR